MRRLIVRTAAVVVVCVFASLPTLARVHDRLSTRDDVASFRPSKNLERPHEKIGAATLACPVFALAAPDSSRCGDVIDGTPPRAAGPFVAPRTSRAPPVR